MNQFDLSDIKGASVADANTKNLDLSDLGAQVAPTDTNIIDNDAAISRARNAWDIAKESKLTLSDANSLQDKLTPATPADGLFKRFGKQLYNSAIANTLHELGKSDTSAAEVRAHQLIGQYEKDNNVSFTDELYNEQLKDWTQQLTLPPQARESDYLRNEPQYQQPKPDINPFAAYTNKPTGTKDKIVDAVAGVIGFTAQVALLKRVAPTMPNSVSWEVVNLSNGGKPGAGAAMQITLGKINQFIPQTGILPAAGRAGAASVLFGTTTYIGGGDTEDILINMGIPFAFEGIGITKDVWANTPNKSLIIESLQKKAPALESRSEAEIDKVISDTLTNVSEADTTEPQGQKVRGFVTSVKEQFPEMQNLVEGQYMPRSTDELAIKARNLILDDITKAEEVAKGSDDIAVAVASELLKFYNERAAQTPDETVKNAFYEKAAEIANESAVKLTELGRAVQAASILGRLTPEGMARFAAREIQRYNAGIDENKGGVFGLKKKIPNLTPEQLKFITTEMDAISQMPEGEAKAIRFKKFQDTLADIIPTPVYKRIVTVWKAGLLTGVKTSGLNILANASNYAAETIKDIPAAIVDKTVSIFTGERTVTPTAAGTFSGSIEGARKGLQYIRTGYDERNIGTKLDYKKTSFGKGKIGKGLQAYTDTVFHIIGAEDEPFYYAAKLRSLYEQAKVQAINSGLKGTQAQQFIDNLLENPTDKMLKYAAKDAETAVFQNDTILAQAAKGIQRLPGGEIVVPFGRTPSAVAMQIVNYTPVGIAKTIIENIGKGKFDQREFSKGIGRGITGLGVLAIGGYLFGQGLMTLDRPTSEKEQKLWELEGRLPNSIKVNGTWRSVQTLGAAGNLLLIGGHFKRAFSESGSPTEAMANSLGGSAKSFTEQTFLRGVNQFTDALSDPQKSAPAFIGNTLASVVPTFVSDVSRATDTKERRAITTTDRVKMRIPGLRETLEPQINVLGKEKTITANPLEIMIDPTRPSKDISNSITKELRRLWDAGYQVSPALLGDKNGYEPLTAKENTDLWKRAGQIANDTLDKLVNSDNYAAMDDFTKADAIAKIVESARKITKAEMVVKKLNGLQGQAFIDTLTDLQKSGLADKELFPEMVKTK